MYPRGSRLGGVNQSQNLRSQGLPIWLPLRNRVEKAAIGKVKIVVLVAGCMLAGHLIIGIFTVPDFILSNNGDGPNTMTSKPGSQNQMKSELHKAPNRVVDMATKLFSWKSTSESKMKGVMPLANDEAVSIAVEMAPTTVGSSLLGGPSSVASAPDKNRLSPFTKPVASGTRMTIGKVSAVFGAHNARYQRALRTHDTHNRLHGYPMHVQRREVLADVWTKPAHMLGMLVQELSKPAEERLEWLLWVDADTVILNPYIPLETFLPPEGSFDEVRLLVSYDWNGLNNGVFFARVCDWSIELFSAIVSWRHYNGDKNLPFRDQSAMAMLLKEAKFKPHVLQVPQRWFNAYQGEVNETLAPHQVRRGDVLVHFAGVVDRDQRMDYWLDRAERHAPDWEMDLGQTSYPEETRQFWAEKEDEKKRRLRDLQEKQDELRKLIDSVKEQWEMYQNEIAMGQRIEIKKTLDEAEQMMKKMETEQTANGMKEMIDELKTVAKPVTNKASQARKELVRAAHSVIIAAEQTTVIDTPGSDAAQRQADVVQVQLAELKEALILPDWDDDTVRAKVDRLREAHEKLTAMRLQAEDDDDGASNRAAI